MPLADGSRVRVARRPLARLLGLAWLGRTAVGDCALLIPHCSCVHTFGMRFALDIAFLDANGAVMRRLRSVPPRRVVRCPGARAALERPAAQAEPTSDAKR
jgi:uncharacterized protein